MKRLKSSFYMLLLILIVLQSCKKNRQEPTAATKYTIRFESNGGSPITAQTVTNNQMAIKPSDPIKGDYIFFGWFTDASATKYFEFTTPITADLVLYAAWHPITNSAAFDYFMEHARFMPNDPRQMTAADKIWFSEQAAFNFRFTIKPNGIILTTDQENRLRVYFDGVIKTLNYVVYTKPFALATKAMFEDRRFYYTPPNDGTPDQLPSAIGTILLMRGMNTDFLTDKQLTFTVEQRDGNYIGSRRGSSIFDPQHDKYTQADLDAGKRLSYLLPGENTFTAGVTMPLGNALEKLKPYEDIWMYDYTALKAIYNADNDHYFSRGFIFDLTVHEFLHSFFKWSHVGGGDNTDLTYSYSGMTGWLMDGRSETRKILTDTKLIPIEGSIDVKMQSLDTEFGGHMPMAYYSGGPYFGFNNNMSTYNVLTMYIQNQLSVPIYNPVIPANTLFISTKPLPTDTKAIPANPFEGIIWKTKYIRFQ